MQRRDAALLCLGLGVILFRLAFLTGTEINPELLVLVGKEVALEGTVVNDPEQRENSLHAHVETEVGTVLVLLPRATTLLYGDTISARGKLVLPEPFETDTGRTFDYPGYLHAKGIEAILEYAELEERQPYSDISLQGTLYKLKHAFEHSLERILPEPDVSLMEGVLLGERRGIPEDLNQAFITSGLVHMVVLSGYNIAIVSTYVLVFFSLFLPKRYALGAGGIAIVLFALMTGAGATTVRASVMGLIAILARYLNRPAAALRALALAALLMIVWNPFILLHDPSFILSVIATFGLITLSPWVEGYTRWVPEHLKLREIAASTIAVQIYILPALLYMTGVLSVFALPANMLALPVVSSAMLGGFLSGLLGLLHPLFGLPFAMLTDIILKWIIAVAEITNALPLSSATIPAFPFWVVILIYIPLTLFAIAKSRSAVQRQTN
jgi:competence protein ComEC